MMEKADNTIPSREELAAYIKESAVSVTNTYEQSPVVLMVDDAVIGTLGNFSASIGKAKSKKTFNVSAIVASALSGSTVLHYRSMFPENKRKILYIDTEQGQHHCQLVLKRILRLAGLPDDEKPDNLLMLSLRKFAPKIRMLIVEEAIGTIPDLGLVIVDGIRDFLYDINSSSESTDIISKFMQWTDDRQIHIHTVLHQNKNDEHARGHIGTELNNMYTNTSQNPVYISSGKSWNCLIGWCEDINQKWKDKDFNIITEVSYNDKYRLNSIIPIKTFVNRINILVQSPLEDAAQDLVAGLVKPHSVSPHKTVQVSLEEISKTLSKISTKLDTVDETD